MNADLAKFDIVRASMEAAKVENDKLVFDYETPEGGKAARSHIAKLRKIKTVVAEIHKEVKADALAIGRECDAKKREYIAYVDDMVAVHNEPLEAIKARKQAVIDAKLAEAKAAEEARQADLERREAEVAAKEAKQRQAERDARIAKEAAEKAAKDAKFKAEQTARRKVEAAERAAKAAEQAARDAEAKANREARELAEKIEREKRQAKAEAMRLLKIETDRMENSTHRKTVEAGAMKYLETIIGDAPHEADARDIAEEIIECIQADMANGEKIDLSINY